MEIAVVKNKEKKLLKKLSDEELEAIKQVEQSLEDFKNGNITRVA